MALRVDSLLTRWLTRWMLALLTGCGMTAALADPPGRVGRVAEVSGGEAWLYTPDGGEWVAAERNRPLTTGDRLSTDATARAEIQIGSATVRLDGGTELEVLRIDDEEMRLQLHGGSVATRLDRTDTAAEFRLVTDEGEFKVRRAGRYRFDRGEGTTQATVYSGEALYEGPFSAQTLYSGQRGEFWLDRGVAQYSIVEPRHDEFASWNEGRDRAAQRSASARYVSPEMTGMDELDRHGRWEQDTEYGALWIPSVVPVGWAPYAAGRWVWVSPWGWTWVDAAPWGFAPFHYGRWVLRHDTWCWSPGGYVPRPVYAPALVAWIGGPNFSVAMSSGHVGPAVGWFPLAPHEVYVPGYHVSPRYVRHLNRGHVERIDNIALIVGNPQQAVSHVDYRNRRHHHAVTVMPRSALHEHRPVGEFRDRPGRGARDEAMLIAAPGGGDRPPGFRGDRPRGERVSAPPSPVIGTTIERRGFVPGPRERRFESQPYPGSAAPVPIEPVPRLATPGRVQPPQPQPQWRSREPEDHDWRRGPPRGHGRDDNADWQGRHRDRSPRLAPPQGPTQPGFAPAPRQDNREPRRHHHGGPAPQDGRRGPPDRALAR